MFWRGNRGAAGAATPKEDEEKFTTYGQVRDAVESEKEIMKLLVDLGEEDFNKLMNASEAYLKGAVFILDQLILHYTRKDSEL